MDFCKKINLDIFVNNRVLEKFSIIVFSFCILELLFINSHLQDSLEKPDNLVQWDFQVHVVLLEIEAHRVLLV